MDSQELNQLKEALREAVRQEIQSAIALLMQRLDNLEKRLDNVDARLQKTPSHTEVQALIEHVYDKQAISTQNELRVIHESFKLVDTRFERVENRLAMLSRQLNNIGDGLAELRSDQKNYSTSLISLEENVMAERTDMQSQYSALQAHLRELEARVAKLEAARHG
ncbi:MAG: hypothetical protein FJ030_15300 [Chloroflexi bacterium]|nr:hypothetical protein [Chloroflexota bacterium]